MANDTDNLNPWDTETSPTLAKAAMRALTLRRGLSDDCERRNLPDVSIDVAKIIGKLRAAYPVAKAEHATVVEARLMLLMEDCAEVAPDILTEACRRVRQTSKFMPMAAEIYEHVRTIEAERLEAARLRRLVVPAVFVLPAPETNPINWRCSPDEVEALNALYAGIGTTMRYLPDGRIDPATC